MTTHRTTLSPAVAQRVAAAIVARSRARYGDATMTAGTGEQQQTGEQTSGQGGDGAGQGGEQPSSTGGAQNGGQPEARFTQGDLDRILGERLASEKAKHDQALKDAQELAGKNETERLQAQLEQANSRATQVTQQAAQRIARTEARGAARDLDVRPDRLDAVLKQADLTSAIGEDGEVDDAKVKAAVEKVLADYPEWKKAAVGPSQSGGELNGGGSDKPRFTRKQLEEMPADEMARRIDEINEAMRDGRVTG